MKRGRKPKPSAAKKLAGNPGRRELNPDEPQYEAAIPDCPAALDKEAKAEWHRLAQLLHAKGVLTEADRGVMTVYCQSWSNYVKATKDVNTYGQVLVPKDKAPYQSPFVNVQSMAVKQLMTAAAELGLTPSSRSRVSAVKVVEASTDDKRALFHIA